MIDFIKELFGFNKPKTVNVTFSNSEKPEFLKKYIAVTGTIKIQNISNYDTASFNTLSFVTLGDKVGFFSEGVLYEGIIKNIEIERGYLASTGSIFVVLLVDNELIHRSTASVFPLENQNYKIYREFSVFKIEQDANNGGKYQIFEQKIYRVDRLYSSEEIGKQKCLFWQKICLPHRNHFVYLKDDIKEEDKTSEDTSVAAAFETKESALEYINIIKKRVAVLEAEYKKNVELEKKYKAEAIIVE